MRKEEEKQNNVGAFDISVLHYVIICCSKVLYGKGPGRDSMYLGPMIFRVHWMIRR